MAREESSRKRHRTGSRSRAAPTRDSGWEVGVDTGGTFTDIVARKGSELYRLKLPSTPDDPSRAILSGLASLGEDPGIQAPRVVHGSTVATNTILERKGARVAFLTTAGFRDLVKIARQTRPALYDFDARRPEPLVSRRLRVPVGERIGPGGEILRPLELEELESVIASLPGSVEAIAVGFLFSCENPRHEEMARRAIRSLRPGIPITLSCEVSPEIREYERFSTAILNAYVGPRMVRYLDRLEKEISARSLEVMGSAGGKVSLDRARAEPVGTFLSGPAAGVLGAARVAAAAGFENIITFDMGGTSSDVSLLRGEPSFRNDSEIAGLPVRYPILDVHTVGAGGGSIARLDAGGGLRVGPESAGADPGPAVYGRGNELTVTDAHVFLGHLAGDSFLGGDMEIQPQRAVPLVESLARKAGVTPVELALGVIDVVDAEMERAIRVVSQQRGHDPRAFTLVAFGGASGLHAAAMARHLLIPRVLIPGEPGLLCALGMLDAERIRRRSRTVQKLASEVPAAALRALARRLVEEAREDFPGVARKRLRAEAELDLRFEGQTHVLTLPAPALLATTSKTSRARDGDHEQSFRSRYEEAYGIAGRDWKVELVTLRVALRETTDRPPKPRRRRPKARKRAGARGREHRSMHLESARRRRVPILSRDSLRAGDELAGPVLITEYSGTTLVPDDYTLRVDAGGNLVLTRGE